MEHGGSVSGSDIQSMSDSIGKELFPDSSSAEPATPIEAAPEPTPDPAPQVRAVPDSWKKEMHEHWGKLDPKVQDYWEAREREHADGFKKIQPDVEFAKSMRGVFNPYQQLLQQKGLDPQRATADLMQAYVGLTQGTPQQRWANYQQLAKNFQLSDPASQAPVDPRVQQLEQQFSQMQQALTAQHNAVYRDAQAKASQEVEAFASDTKAHPYFSEVADDIASLLKSGLAPSLQEAYDRAVRMNPVTYQKEVARIQTEHEAKLKENARLEALPKQKAKGVNVQDRATERTPTEPLGTMEDTIRKAYRASKEKVVH